MRDTNSRLASAGLLFAALAAACAGQTTPSSGSSSTTTTATDSAALVASATEGATSYQGDASTCLDAFAACLANAGATADSCKSTLDACLPDPPAKCGGKGPHPDGGGAPFGPPPDGSAGLPPCPPPDGSAGAPPEGCVPPPPPNGAGGAPPAGCMPPPPPDGAGGAPPAGGCMPPPPPPGGAGGAGPMPPCGRHHHGPPKCIDGIDVHDAVDACRTTFDACVSGGSAASDCASALKTCLHDALAKGVDDLCSNELEACGSSCDGVANACSHSLPSP